MKIYATKTSNDNFLVNVDNTVFLYTDQHKKHVIREISEKEMEIAWNTWAKEHYQEEFEREELSKEVLNFIDARINAYKLETNKFEEHLSKIEFYKSDFYSIVKSREADWGRHDYSHAIGGDPINLTDTEIHNLFKMFLNQEPYIEAVLSDIRWIESGGCEGDDLYPVTMQATLLGNGKYFIEINSRNNTDIYLYEVS